MHRPESQNAPFGWSLRACTLAACAFLLLAAAARCRNAAAQQSHFNVYDQSDGLDVGEIIALAQDDAGFLWLGANRGLLRFDGRNFVPWGRESVDEPIADLAYGPRDELLARTIHGRAMRKIGTRLEPLAGADGKPIVDLESFVFDTEGNLWTVRSHAVWRRDRDGRWQDATPVAIAAETPRMVRAAGRSVIVLTDQAAWRLSGTASERVFTQQGLWAAAGDDSRLWLARRVGGGLWRVDDAGVHELTAADSRLIDLRLRGSTLWLAYDTQMIAIDERGRQRSIGIADGLPSGGPLLVDHEGSLWLGTFVGLAQFPEPETMRWSLPQGLPWPHAYGIDAAAGLIWVATWTVDRLVQMDPRDGTLTILDAANDVCSPDGEQVWGTRGTGLLRWHASRFERLATLPQAMTISACALDRDGTFWFITDTRALLKLPAGAAFATAVELRFPEGISAMEHPTLLWADRTVLFVATATRICRLQALRSDAQADALDCTVSTTPHKWVSQHRPLPETTWLTARYEGVFALEHGRLRRLPASDLAEGGTISTAVAAVDGSTWLTGVGAFMRVRACDACASGWRVVEAPGLWQGLPGNAALDVAETESGDLWIAGNRGVWRVPRAVRGTPHKAPRLVPVRALIDAVSHEPQAPLELAPDQHRLDLEFAALSYRDRSLLRYRSRINGGEWSPSGRNAQLQFTTLDPGRYRAEMSASLDGEHWSDPPTAVEFTVQPPWYATWWARAAFAASTIALLAWLYRLRVASLLRVQSERTRIAMDLHDEIGSGLGSIGMLAGAAARGSAVEREHIVEEIAGVSASLGSRLRSLVWSLRADNAGLAELAEQIADHARRLFRADRPHLTLRLPGEAGTSPLGVNVRRHALLLALEAMHNTAHHAGARNVGVTVECLGAHGFRLIVEDDGTGFDVAAATAGTGLASMRQRAISIEADLCIASGPGGTRVCLTYPARRQA